MISTRRGALLAAVAVLVVSGIAAALLLIPQPERPPTAIERTFAGISAEDLARARVFDAKEREALRRGRDGLGHPLYAETRGGVERTAAIMDRLSPYFERFGRKAEVDPLTVAAVVMVASGGRADLTEQPDSSAGPAGLAGLTPKDAQDAGLRVDTRASDELTRRIDRLTARQSTIKRKSEAAELDPRLIAMRAKRRKLDERFDVVRAIDAAARILGDPGVAGEDRAVAAYRPGEAAFPFLVEAARQILELYRDDPARLYRLATLHGTKPGAEDVLRPPGEPDSYASHDEIEHAFESGELVPLALDPARAGFVLGDDRDSRRVFSSELHRGLRPAALATLMYVAGSARREADESLTLELGGAVRPETGKQRLEAAARSVGDGVAGPGAPLSRRYLRPPASTGYSFELLRNLSGDEQAAVDAVLARLRALNVVEVVRDGDVDRVTVGPRAGELLEAVREHRRYPRSP